MNALEPYLRLAAAIGIDARDRESIFMNMKRIYTARSTIAHGGKVKVNDLDARVAEAKDYLRRLIFEVAGDPRKCRHAFLDSLLVNWNGAESASLGLETDDETASVEAID
jgi:hypothetical protein